MSESPTSWRRSRRCESSACVEVALIGEGVALRDSKDPNGPRITFTLQEWRSFVTSLQEDVFIQVGSGRLR